MPLREEISRTEISCELTGAKFIPYTALQNIITLERTKQECRSSWYSSFLLWCSNCQLESNFEQMRRVIAVLALAGKLDILHNLLSEGITDDDLPASIDSDGRVKSHHGKEIQSLNGFPSLFFEMQWKIWTPDLGSIFQAPTHHLSLVEKHCVFPFDIDKTATVSSIGRSLYKASVPSSYCKEEGKNEADLTYAIKKIHEWKEGDEYLKKDPFTTEQEILDQLKNTANPHVVQPLAVLPGARLFVFPWADGGDLRQWWKDTTRSSLELPPSSLSSWFLDQILGLASAVKALHEIGSAPGNSTNIRHGDLKPENIVYFSGPDGSLGMMKIIDFGVSKIHHNTTFDRKLDPEQDVTNTTSSTHTYEAPEASARFEKTCRSRRYDCWSLGCIFLEFAVWLLYDGKAALNVRDDEGRECKRYCKKSVLNSSSPRTERIEDVFEVHPSVCEAITTLLGDSRCCDADGRGWTAVGDVVRVIKDNLLQVRYEDRFESSRLCERLEEIRKKAAGDSSDGYLTNWQETPDIPQIFRPPLEPLVKPQNTWDKAG